MRRVLFGLGVLVVLCSGSSVAQQPAVSRYLVTWVGDADGADSDFLATLDVTPGSKTYAQIISTVAAGARGTMPHHSEHFFSPGHPLFVNGFAGNQTFRFDLADPLHPRLLGALSPVPGLAFPHSMVRLPNGNVLATMQANGPTFAPPGGLAEFRDDGTAVRSASAANDVDPGARPYSLLVLPAEDRIVVTCGRMFLPRGVAAPSDLDHQGFAIQLWRLSDLRLLKTVALKAPEGARAGLERNPYEPRRTNAGDILFATGSGGLFRITGLEPETFRADLLFDFGGASYLALVVDHYWIQAVASQRRVVALDISRVAKPSEISRVTFDERQQPHWLARDELSNRIIVANSNEQSESRLWMLQFEPVSGLLSLDPTFHDRGDDRPGVSFEREQWPHGHTGRGVPHGSVFIR
jgi:hypothetical protein